MNPSSYKVTVTVLIVLFYIAEFLSFVIEVGEIDQQLRVLSAFAENLDSVIPPMFGHSPPFTIHEYV